jgi:hypothetical protein
MGFRDAGVRDFFEQDLVFTRSISFWPATTTTAYLQGIAAAGVFSPRSPGLLQADPLKYREIP